VPCETAAIQGQRSASRNDQSRSIKYGVSGISSELSSIMKNSKKRVVLLTQYREQYSTSGTSWLKQKNSLMKSSAIFPPVPKCGMKEPRLAVRRLSRGRLGLGPHQPAVAAERPGPLVFNERQVVKKSYALKGLPEGLAKIFPGNKIELSVLSDEVTVRTPKAWLVHFGNLVMEPRSGLSSGKSSLRSMKNAVLRISAATSLSRIPPSRRR